ncbi:MAG TPA: hypothetical protein VGC13_17485 [Longimicrobium sp.]|jgi:hypothetical protein|uniref:hypothetical protein n=1 Tax=Longimicrobium sp. TaxID=2029185 RepID=UPI002ED87E4E
MATPLDKPIKRELEIDGKPYMVTVSPEGVKVVEKGKRKGHELSWSALVSGDAALAAGLRASLDALPPRKGGGA